MPKKENKGEINEVFLKAFLTKKFHLQEELEGAPESLKYIIDLNFGPETTVPEWNDNLDQALENKDYEALKPIFKKANSSYKADARINDVAYSLKYKSAANPAVINHTHRQGFLKVCNRLGEDIGDLDKIIDKYWELRLAGTIKEDTCNYEKYCPFKEYKDQLSWILHYFIFNGTARGPSEFPATQVLSFYDPFDPSSYEILNYREVIGRIWPNLRFSIRSKGTPQTIHKELIPWVRTPPPNHKPRGALHVRVDTRQ